MTEKPETIEILACITPGGDFLLAHNTETIENVSRNWWTSRTDEQKAQHKAAGTFGGYVRIRMLKSEYDAIPCTNESYALSRDPPREGERSGG